MTLGMAASALLLIASVFLVTRRYDIRRIDDPAVLAFLFLAVFWLAGPIVAFMFPMARQATPASMALMLIGFGSYVVGMWYGEVRRNGPERQRYATLRPTTSADSLIPAVSTLCAGLLLLLLYFVLVGGVPALASDAENTRVHAVSGKGYIVIPGLALTLFGATAFLAVAHGRRTRILVLALLSAILSGVLILGVGMRGPILVLGLAAIWVLVFSKGLPSIRVVVLTGVLSLIVLGAVAQWRAGSSMDVTAVATRAAWTTYVNTSNLSLLADLVPGNVSFFVGGTYLLDLAVLLPGSQPNVGAILKEAAGMNFAGGGITIGLIGESFVNFGSLGVAAICAGVGFAFARVRGYLPMGDGLDLSLSILVSLTLVGVMNSGMVSPLLYQVLPILAAYGTARLLALLLTSGSNLTGRRRFWVPRRASQTSARTRG